MSITYERPTMDEEKRFMAKRIRNWIMKPESDPELTEIVKAGKIEALIEHYLKNYMTHYPN